VYTTAFNVMNLEIYYRYLPCYQVGAEFGLAKLVTDEEWDVVLENARKGKFDEVAGTADESPVEKEEKAPEAKPEAGPRPAPAGRPVAELVADLRSEDMMTRRNAAKELSIRREMSAVEALITAAKTERTSLRPVLVEYLGAFGESDAAIEYLIGELESADDRIQSAALTGLRNATGETSLGKDVRAWKTWWSKHLAERKKE
jgi:hypothetical protein